MNIKKRTTVKYKDIIIFWLWWYMIITPVIIYWMGVPRFFLYIGDAVGLFLLMIASKNFVTGEQSTVPRTVRCLFAFYIVFGSFGALYYGNGIIPYLWGLRNCGRLFLFFYLATQYLTVEDFKKLQKIMHYIFWISLPLCIYEAYFIKYAKGTIIGDHVGGLYHGFAGVTMPLNLILLIVSTEVVIKYFQKEIRTWKAMVYLFVAVYMSGLAELKVFILELAIIVIVNMIANKFNWRMVIVTAIGIVALSYVISFFVSVNSRGAAEYMDVFTVDGFVEYLSSSRGYDGIGDLNRIRGIEQLNGTLFKDDWFQHIFGLGIGAGEYTNFFSTRFYEQYEYLHYQWFQLTWTYVENGYIGILLMLGVIIGALRNAIKYISEERIRKYVLCMIILMPLLFLYNLSMRADTTAFYLFFVLALPFIYKRGEEL